MPLQNLPQLFDLPVEKFTGVWRLLIDLWPVFEAVGLTAFLIGGLAGGGLVWLLLAAAEKKEEKC